MTHSTRTTRLLVVGVALIAAFALMMSRGSVAHAQTETTTAASETTAAASETTAAATETTAAATETTAAATETTAVPAGGVNAGFGGAAPKSGGHPLAVASIIALVALAGTWMVTARRRRVRGN